LTKGISSNVRVGVNDKLIADGEGRRFGDCEGRLSRLVGSGEFDIRPFVFVKLVVSLFEDDLSNSIDDVGVDGGSVLRIVSINLNQPRIWPGESEFDEDILFLSF
jgi:hypothetical protein